MKMAALAMQQQRPGARPCRGWRAGGRPCIRRRALESGNGSSSSPSSSPSSADVVSLLEKKVAVLENVSGSDRGFGFDAELRKAVTTSVEDLCAGCPAGEAKDATGTWRLVYSTNFGPEANPRGGSRSQPLLPLGQVYQRIDVEKGRVDNIVNVDVPLLGTIELCLEHDLRVEGDSYVITFTGTKVAGSSFELPSLPNVLDSLPQALKPPQQELSSASFVNAYVDATMRVSRGDRGELRVYVK